MRFVWARFVRNTIDRLQHCARRRMGRRLRDRRGFTLSTRPIQVCCEQLESRQLLSAIVVTDQPDYAPGSTAHFTASNDAATTAANFQAGEAVYFHMDRTDGGTINAPPAVQDWTVTDGVGDFTPYQDSTGLWIYPDTDGTADGSIGTDWYVDPQFAGAALLITATGESSGAVATEGFTDTPGLTTFALAEALPSQAYGTSETFTATATGTGSNLPAGTVTFRDGSTILGTVSSTDAGYSHPDAHAAVYTFSISTLHAGIHSNITASFAADSHYADATSSAISDTVNKANVSYTIGSQNQTYGTAATLANPTFNTGINGQNLTVTESSTGDTATAHVGTYSITGVAANGTGLASDYNVSFTDGTLTVGKASVS